MDIRSFFMTERSQEQIETEIKELLETHVAPAVAAHGGVVNFHSYSNGTVMLEMSGACSGCAGSTMTLKMGVENLLTSMIPEVESVEGFDDPFSDVNPFYSQPMHHYDTIDTFEDDDFDSNN